MRAETILRRSLLGVCALVLALGFAVGDASAAKKPWENFKFPELGEVHVPDFERHVLDNGLIVYLLQDSTWPLVEGQVLVRTGAAFEPASKVGLASITGDVLRTGGTTTVAADALDEELERMGAYIESGIGDTSGTLRFSFLSQDLGRGLDLVSDVLRHPAFDQEKIDVAVEGMRASVARRNDDLNGIVSRELQRAVWGKEHPYARNVEYATLDAITRDDLVGFYEYFYHPDNMMMAVWGDFDTDEMLAKIQKVFGDWPAGNVELPPFPNEPQQEQVRRVLVADKTDVNQTRFALGHIGMRADDPDYYAMSVGNRVLGGGFGDRLFNEVRSKRGLAYNVGSSAGVDFARPGVFQAYCATKSETTQEALGVVLETVEAMREEKVDEQELNDAKEAILNSNVFNYVTKEQVLTRKMTLEYLGYPEDFLESYNEKIRAVDSDAVLDVMKRRVHPDRFAIVAVGKTEDWDGDLTEFGPVEELDISIPEPEGPEFPAPTDEAVEKGRAVLAAAQKAHGGSRLAGMTALRRKGQATFKVQGMELNAEISSTIVFPDRSRQVIQSPMFGELIQVVDRDTAWAQSAQGVQDLPSSQAEESRLDIVTEPLYLLGHYDAFPVQLLESEEVEGVQADVVLVWVDDQNDKWEKLYFDPQTHLLLKTQSKGKHPFTQAPGIQDNLMRDYAAFDGVQVARTEVLYHDGEELIDIETVSLEIDPKIDDADFAKPAS